MRLECGRRRKETRTWRPLVQRKEMFAPENVTVEAVLLLYRKAISHQVLNSLQMTTGKMGKLRNVGSSSTSGSNELCDLGYFF